MSSTHVQAAPPETVMPMITGHWVAQIVRTHIALGIPDLLRGGGLTASQVAKAAQSDELATFRLLRAGVAIGLVRVDADTQRFEATPVLVALQSDAPGSLANLALVWTDSSHWLPWGQLTQAVRSGTDQLFETLGATTIFDYFSQNTDLADLFGRAVTEMSRPVITEALASIDPGAAATVVDVGGANGDFVLRLLQLHPALSGVVFDLAGALGGARAAIEQSGLGDRCEAVGGDFFDHVPAGDLYLLKYILHDWDDDRCVRILRSVAAAMRPGARVLVVDALIGDPSDPGKEATLMDMNMLTMAPGREHDLGDFDRLFVAAGLRRVSVTRVLGSYHMIEAVAVDPA